MKKRSKTTNEKLIEINRHCIGSINLTDIVNVDRLTPAERLDYLKGAEHIFKSPIFQNELKIMIQTQLEFIGWNSADFEQVLMGRGTLNGIDLLMERFSKLYEEYKQATRPEDKDFDKFNPLPGV